jgi:hypothetical protein
MSNLGNVHHPKRDKRWTNVLQCPSVSTLSNANVHMASKEGVHRCLSRDGFSIFKPLPGLQSASERRRFVARSVNAETLEPDFISGV